MSGIANIKQGIGWMAPSKRACCRNCAHVAIEHMGHEVYKSNNVRCGKHAFYTSIYAICNDWADAVGVRG